MPEGTHQSGAVAKICGRCGRDCAGRPRTRDTRGNYVCGECVQRLKAGDATMPGDSVVPVSGRSVTDRRASAEPPAGPAVPAVPPAPMPIDNAPIDGAPIPIDDDPIPLDDNSIPLDADPIGLSEPLSPGPTVCKGCGQLMSAKAVVCISCGFDVRTNTVHVGPEPKGPKCFNCGYSLYGIKVKNCPECGAATGGRERVLAAERKNARDEVRDAYLKPVYMFAGGMAVSVVMTMLLASGFSAGVVATAGLLLKYAIYVPFGVLVFLACCLIWIGFNAPVHLTALRLAGIYAVTDAVGILVAFIPLPIIPMLILVTVYVGLLQDMLELDLIDAAAVGLITFIARHLVLMIVATYVGKWLGI